MSLARPGRPTSAATCSIRGTIYITSYSRGVIPDKSATRRLTMSSVHLFALADLDDYAEQQGWSGDALDNLTETLDAIIDGQLR